MLEDIGIEARLSQATSSAGSAAAVQGRHVNLAFPAGLRAGADDAVDR